MDKTSEMAIPVSYGLMKTLKYAWKRYMRFSVIENDDIIDILFHSYCGAIFTKMGFRYQEAGKDKTPRIHAFFIQSSGTGKTECFNALTEIVNLTKINDKNMIGEKIGTANEAAITGTAGVAKDSGQEWSKNGMLENVDVFCFDEGSALLEESTPAQTNVMNQLQLAMDEPGVVRKFMRDASIKYSTNASIVSGSYFYENFRKTMLSRGFLQRMFFTYRMIPADESERIAVGLNELKIKGTNNDRMKYIEELAKYMNVFDNPKKPKLLLFNKEDVLKFNNDWKLFRRESVTNFFTDEKQEILNTYYNRSMNIVNKFSIIHGIIAGRDIVNYEDLMYGLFYARKHILYVNEMLNKVYKEKKDIKFTREMFIFNILKVRGTVTQHEMVNFLLNEARLKNQWDLARNKTLSFIQNAEFIKRTRTIGKKNSWSLSIDPKFIGKGIMK